MGYDIWIIDPEDGERVCGTTYGPHLGDLTYNYTSNIECHKYWKPKRDFDGKTVGEAIATLEHAVAQMIADGFPTEFLCESNILESMLKKMFLLYAELIKVPRQYQIELES
jgi:hypothetical protein